MTDMLEAIWDLQRHQQQGFGLDPDVLPIHEREKLLKDLCLGLYEEAQELAREVASHKDHILKQRPVEKGNVIDEVVDIMKYTISIAQVFNIQPEEVLDAFIHKSHEVGSKADSATMELQANTKLLISDLDGCIADLSGFQAELAKARNGAPMNDQMVLALEGLKERYYKNGGFRTLPVIPGAKEALDKVASWGFKIALITARPHWQYKRVYSDTLAWLRENGVKHDLLLFNKDKSEAIYEHIFPARPIAFVEDRDKHALELVNIGVRVLLIDTPDNRTIPTHPLIHRVKDWGEILEWLETNRHCAE